MQPLIVLLILGAAVTVLYPPAALAIFLLGALVTGWAAWKKARTRSDRRDGD